MKNALLLLVFLMSYSIYGHSQNPLTDSLIAWYPFDGNALDASGNGNDGTVNGAVLTNDRFGNYSAYYFDGSNDYISYQANNKFKPTTFPFSIACWIKSSDNSVVGPFFKNDDGNNFYSGITFQIHAGYNGALEIHYGDGGPAIAENRRSKIGTIPVNDNEWHFVAAVIRGPADMDLYIDCAYDPGNYDGSGGSIYYSNADGISGVYHVLGNLYYDGRLDDLRFYHRALTLYDLQTLYSYPASYTGLSINLGSDILLCAGAEAMLSPTTTGSVQSYLWSNGSQSSSLTVDQSGSYWVSVFDGCSYANDTVNVILSKAIAFYLPEDTVVCAGQSFVLNAGNFFDTYLWSTGQTSSSITVTSSGIYSATVSLNGCTATDSTEVSFITCTGIDGIGTSNLSMIYDPENHTVNFINEDSPYPLRISVEMINSLGQKVFESEPLTIEGTSGYSIHLPENLAGGIYLLNAKEANQSIATSAISYFASH